MYHPSQAALETAVVGRGGLVYVEVHCLIERASRARCVVGGFFVLHRVTRPSARRHVAGVLQTRSMNTTLHLEFQAALVGKATLLVTCASAPPPEPLAALAFNRPHTRMNPSSETSPTVPRLNESSSGHVPWAKSAPGSVGRGHAGC